MAWIDDEIENHQLTVQQNGLFPVRDEQNRWTGGVYGAFNLHTRPGMNQRAMRAIIASLQETLDMMIREGIE